MSNDIQYMGGTANVVYISDSEGIAAMTGSFKGGAYARVTGDRVDVGNGRTEFPMEHFFIHEDGSTIFTQDKSFIQQAVSGEITAGGTDYTVVAATGRFEGMGGTFHSRGGWLFDKGVGVLRFEGQIGR
ncbi:MAG: hypothetical protein AAFQ67_05560 [Pseudomonadota bacterium]